MCWVLGGAVLRVVDEEVDPHSQLEARRPIGFPRKVACPEGGLVIRDVGEAYICLAEPVTDGRPGVRHEGRQDLQAADGEASQGDIMERESARQVTKADWKKGGREIPREAGAQVEGRRGRSPNMNLPPWLIERFEESEPLDMIHVEVRQEDVYTSHLRPHPGAEAADPGAGIEHQQGTVVAAHLDTRGIPPVTNGLRPRRR
jgi:hypothetical protein